MADESRTNLSREKSRESSERTKGDVVAATEAVEDFFKKTLKKPIANVVKTTTVENGWEARVEVVSESESMKAIGKKIMEKHLYDVVLDKNLRVSSYDRQ